MKEKIYQVCEEMLKNEEEAKKFASYESLDELYEYFLSKLPGLTKDEFEEFICEALDNYAKEKENVNKIGEGDLGGVSGGAFDLKTKLTAGALAFMAAMSAIPGMNAANVDNVGEAQSISQTKSVKTKISDTFGRVKSWVKEHPGLTTGIALGAAVLVGTGIFLGVRHSRKAKDSNVGGVAKPTDNKENKESEKHVAEAGAVSAAEGAKKSNPVKKVEKHEVEKLTPEEKVLAFEKKCNDLGAKYEALDAQAVHAMAEKGDVNVKGSAKKITIIANMKGLQKEAEDFSRGLDKVKMDAKTKAGLRKRLMDLRERLSNKIRGAERQGGSNTGSDNEMKDFEAAFDLSGNLEAQTFSGGSNPNALDGVHLDDVPFAGIDDL